LLYSPDSTFAFTLASNSGVSEMCIWLSSGSYDFPKNIIRNKDCQSMYFLAICLDYFNFLGAFL
jgi:hypothetical protein